MEPGTVTFPPRWQAGARLFAAGQWWEAHEAWEPEWLEATGEQRRALQALILLAAALHKRWRMENLAGRNFIKAQAYLRQLSPGAFGVDWQQLERQVAACLAGERAEPLPFVPLLAAEKSQEATSPARPHRRPVQ